MYQYSATSNANVKTVHYLSEDGLQLLIVYITEHERESLGRFKSETVEQLLQAYIEGISIGLEDRSNQLFQYVYDHVIVRLELSASRAKMMKGSLKKLLTNHVVLIEGNDPICCNLLCEQGGAQRLFIRAGNVEIGEVTLEGKEDVQQEGGDDVQQEGGDDIQQEGGDDVLQEGGDDVQQEGGDDIQQEGGDDVQQEGEEIQQGGREDDIDQEGESEIQQGEGDKTDQSRGNEDNQGEKTVHWWNISTPIIVVLFLLLAAVSFFVTLIISGRISL